jgi:thymidylate synthase
MNPPSPTWLLNEPPSRQAGVVEPPLHQSHDVAYLRHLFLLTFCAPASADRTGTGTRRLFSASLEFDVSERFPLLTTKKMFFRGIVEELLWFLRGSVDVRELQAKGVHIWDEWQREDGTIGPWGYGALWRRWNSSGTEVDQIARLIHDLRHNPTSRRMIVSAWDAGRVNEAALPPCHCFWQAVVIGDVLNIQLHQRSGDFFLGIPFNIASYALLLRLLAQLTGLKPGALVMQIADAHLYENHINQAQLQLERHTDLRPSPILEIAPFESLEELTYEHFTLTGYDPHPAISAPVSV